MASKSDPKFLQWLDIVSPAQATTDAILVSFGWLEVLELLLQIFSALLSSGCLKKAAVTRKVKIALKSSHPTVSLEQLNKIHQELCGEKK